MKNDDIASWLFLLCGTNCFAQMWGGIFVLMVKPYSLNIMMMLIIVLGTVSEAGCFPQIIIFIDYLYLIFKTAKCKSSLTRPLNSQDGAFSSRSVVINM